MVTKRYGDELLPYCESVGLAEVRRLRHVSNYFHALDQSAVDRWILVKEAELRDEAISIARDQASAAAKAASAAVEQARWARIAAIIAVAAALVTSKDELFKLIFGAP
ncbi:MAG: hypothetical protein KJ634_05975 [Gammaproteobacteria bacterium]|nr:hypothetical protein [Gammaproteobacteria bacterium]MBU1415152.1 hypothetical protein [Gammaproteobacteria bacterium]